MSTWITKRRPTADDADHERGVWNSEGQWVEWDEVLDNEPWMRTNRPDPYWESKGRVVNHIAKAEGDQP